MQSSKRHSSKHIGKKQGSLRSGALFVGDSTSDERNAHVHQSRHIGSLRKRKIAEFEELPEREDLY